MDKLTKADGSTSLRPRIRHNPHGFDTDISQQSRPKNFDGSSTSAASSRTLPSAPNICLLERDAGPSTNTKRAGSASGTTGGPELSSISASNAWSTSWTSLQDLTSLIFRSNSPGRTINDRSPTRGHLPHQSNYISRSRDTHPVQWGPLGSREGDVGTGSRNDRRAQLQAQKREALFAPNGSLIPDYTGSHKRRNSDDKNTTAIRSDDSGMLVYIHRVKTTDTLAGISIKFQCQPHSIRKQNRLWPNDSIQIREIVYLPVDACALRGRKVLTMGMDPPVLDENGCKSKLQSQQCQSKSPWDADSDSAITRSHGSGPLLDTATSASTHAATSNFEEPHWVHDSWVEIDSFPELIEIVRLKPMSSGYLPRSRRKSLSSDPGDSHMSLDSPRLSYQSSSVRSDTPNASPGHRTRSASSNNVAKSLRGPGGVGTMKTNVRSPGPAQDGLNKMFGAHLPNVAPHSSSDTLDLSSNVVPHDHGGIENVSGVIEGWVRKFANRASASMKSPSLISKTRPGDLIELSEDAFQLTENADDRDIDDGSSSRQNVTDHEDTWQTDQVPRKRLPARHVDLDQRREEG